jgi:hypothetical protein
VPSLRRIVLLVPVVAALSALVAASALAPGGRASERRPSTSGAPSSVSAALAATAISCATPASADRPAIEPGPAVHLVYAIPADGDDRLTETAPAIEGQVAAIEAWWRREDPGRVPRFDRYEASCGRQLDIVTVRLDRSSRSLARLADIGLVIVDDLQAAGLLGPFRTVLAWYDGPGGLPEVCGEGAGELDEEGIALIFTRACPGVPGELIAAHELVHALGALPAGAPNACPEDDGHPCDDPDDVIWPRAATRPLDGVRLDAAHDDYYAHAGVQPDLRDSVFLRRLDERRTRLELTVAGPGAVASDVPGVRCGASCATVWDARLPVRLTATPAAGKRFARWEGACRGRGACVVDLAGGRVAVRAVFAPPVFPLVITVRGSGVVAQGDATRCRRSCTLDLASYAPVRLIARPARGWRLTRWGGACRGAGATCTVTLERASSVRAVFVPVRQAG